MKRVVAGAAVVGCVALSLAAPASASTTWQVQPVPKVPHSIALLVGASCPAKGNCTAVGFYHKDQVGYTLAEHWNGSNWAIQPTPNPAGVSQAFLGSVSCASLTSCTAVGLSTPTAGGAQLLAEQWDGSDWAIEPLPNPAGGIADLNDVSCTAPASCIAVGVFQSGPDKAVLPVAERWNGTRWTAQHPPLPPLASDGQFDGVSCPTASDCVAVGSYTELTQTLPFAEQWNGSRWTVQSVPVPAQSYGQLLSVSCQPPEHCTAVGSYATSNQPEHALVERADGSSWAPQADAAPIRTTLFGVSCPSAASCTAVGQNVSSAGLASRTGVAEYWNGTNWTRQATPVPRRTTTGAILSGVSCLGPGYCTAVGDYAPHGMPLAEHEG